MKKKLYPSFLPSFLLGLKRPVKNTVSIFMFIWLNIVSSMAQCPNGTQILGSNAGVTNLSTALANNFFSVNFLGETTVDLCIDGDFVLDEALNFRNSNIYFLPNSRLLKTTSGHTNVFFQSTISGASGAEIEISNGSDLGFVLTSLSNFQIITGSSNSEIRFINSNLTNINDILITGGATLVTGGANYLNSPIEVSGVGTSLIDFGQTIYDTGCTDVSFSCISVGIHSGASYIGGSGSSFNNNYTGLQGENGALISLFGSIFNGNKLGLSLLNNNTNSFIDNCSFSTNLAFVNYGITADNSSNINTYNSILGNKSGLRLYTGTNNGFLNNIINNDFNYIFSNSNINLTNNNFSSLISLNNSNYSTIYSNEFMSSFLGSNTTFLNLNSNNLSHLNLQGFDFSDIQCNHVNSSQSNAVWLSSSSSNSDIVSMHFFDNVINGGSSNGLRISSSFNDQIDHGNDFYGYGLNGVFGDGNYQFGKFEVRPLPSEYPMHSPPTIMEATGAVPTYECFPPSSDPYSPYNIDISRKCSSSMLEFYRRVIKDLLACRQNPEQSLTGKCHRNMRLVNQIVRLCPILQNDVNEILEEIPQEPTLGDLVTIMVTGINTLPDFHDVQIHINPVLPNKPLSHQLNSTEPTPHNIAEAKALVQEWSQYHLDLQNERTIRIDDLLNEISGVFSDEPSIMKYKNALIWYLEYSQEYTATAERMEEIKLLAEDCEDKDGPGQEIAIMLCELLKIPYNTLPCIQWNSKQQESLAHVRVYPNPTTSILHIEGLQNAVVDIYNAMGELVWMKKGVTVETISVDRWPSGLYFVNINDESGLSTHKIIKMK